ncbi:hypothetical protein CGLO_14511 [Colletotrichum gloeosporioides Cg-14]|uniref:Uncharacterized protein n=1 Tax=Colletotrichum gloeosporioides (strain Cg-14) TaxID=1237896 RepID=T0LDR2_COLGC|nr:hypothetical protein CGLO_14511 [Colletotrichum gloeosporioides Cg-14]
MLYFLSMKALNFQL